MPRASSEDGSSVEQKLQGLFEDPLSPFYVLSGKERYFIRKAVGLLKQRILPSKDLYEVLYHPFYGPEVNGAELVDLACSIPFFEKTRLILVWDAGKLREEDRGDLQTYAERPAPFTCMVFVVGEDAPRGRLFAQLKDHYPKGCVTFPNLKRSQYIRWLERLAEEKGLGSRLSPGFLEGLLSAGQANLECLEKQLEILALYAEDLERGKSLETSPFGPPDISFDQAYLLTDPLLKGDMRVAIDILNRFVDRGVPPLVILSRIAWEIRKLWQFKYRMEEGAITDSFLKSVSIPVFKKAAYVSLTRRLSWRSLGKMFSSLGEADRSLKSSRIDPQYHLEALCEDIARLVAIRSPSPAGHGYKERRH